MKAKNLNKAPMMTKAEFDQIISANEEILRRDPFGIEARRKASEGIRKALANLKVHADAAKKKKRK